MITLKTDEELKDIRAACRVVARVLENLAKAVVPGITTIELDRLAEGLILASGAVPAFKGYRGYKHATCLSVNEEVVHGIPSGRTLREGDIVGVDVGAVVNGFYGDMARTLPVGSISKEAGRLLSVARLCLDEGVSKARAGGHLGDIGEAIEKKARASGYSVVRDLFGHGVGKALHEDPLIPNFGKVGEGPVLKSGMVLAIEPMLNVGGYEIKTLADGWTVVTSDGKLSAHFENTILVGEGEPEILTRI